MIMVCNDPSPHLWMSNCYQKKPFVPNYKEDSHRSFGDSVSDFLDHDASAEHTLLFYTTKAHHSHPMPQKQFSNNRFYTPHHLSFRKNSFTPPHLFASRHQSIRSSLPHNVNMNKIGNPFHFISQKDLFSDFCMRITMSFGMDSDHDISGSDIDNNSVKSTYYSTISDDIHFLNNKMKSVTSTASVTTITPTTTNTTTITPATTTFSQTSSIDPKDSDVAYIDDTLPDSTTYSVPHDSSFKNIKTTAVESNSFEQRKLTCEYGSGDFYRRQTVRYKRGESYRATSQKMTNALRDRGKPSFCSFSDVGWKTTSRKGKQKLEELKERFFTFKTSMKDSISKAQSAVRKCNEKDACTEEKDGDDVCFDEEDAGPFLALTIKRPTIRDIKSFEDDDDDEEVPEHIEFEDLSLLKQSPLHAAVFIKYLINNSDPAAMLFTTIAGLYRTTTSKDQSILQKWAAEIFITFLDDNAPLPVQTSCVDSIRNSVASKDAIQKDIFESAIASIEEKVQEQLREYQGKRQIGLGTLFGDSYLPPPTKNASFSNRSIKNQSQSNIQTAPVNFSKPPLSQTPPSNKSNGSNSSVSSDSHRPPSAHYPLSSSSFTSSSLPFNSNTLSKLHKSPSINTPSTPYNYDISNLEKILWEDLQQNADSPDDWKLAIAICIATIFRNTPGLQISRANSFLFENFPAFLCKDKRALKNRMKKANYKGHQFTPHQCHPLQRPKCSTCLEVVWSIGYQVYTCSACRCTIHGKCLKLVHECAEARKFHKDPNKLSSPSIFYTAEPLSDYDIHRRAVGTPCISSPQPPTGHNSPTPVYSDSDFEVESELPSLSNTILNETLANMDVKSRKYQEVINELFYTERSHLKTLKIMDKEILRPMRADSKISQSLVDLLFPNLEKIIEIHKDISTAFKARKEQGKVVESVGDILYEKFSGEKGEMLQQECAEFCKDQYYSLEALRQCQNKDAYLAQFIQNMAQKRICRKLELKDFLPKVMQRLTKYPLLIEHLLKNSPEDTEEHQQLSLALKSVKVILSHVNQVVRDCENYRRTQEMQRRLDAKGIEGINHPVLLEYNNLNLTEHKMVFEGELQWYQNDLKSTSLLLVLFEDILVILQKVEHKLLLKCQNAMRGGLENSKYMQVPIIKLSHLMTKDIPRENKSFYLVSASREDSQMYKLVARSTEERNRWTRHIKEAVENYRNQYSASPRSNNNNNNKQENNININNNNNNNNSFNDNEDKKSEKLSKKHSLESGTNHEQFESSYESRMDNDKGAKDEEEEEEDEDDTIVDHTASVCNPEDELKRQIVVTHELMIDKITTLSNMHNIVSKHLTQSLPLNLDSATFIRSMHRIIDKMTKFFEEELPIEVINDVTDAGKALEWDPVESLVELGTRLEMYVRQLESLVTKNKVLKQYSNQPQPPPPLSPPPSIEQETL